MSIVIPLTILSILPKSVITTH